MAKSPFTKPTPDKPEENISTETGVATGEAGATGGPDAVVGGKVEPEQSTQTEIDSEQAGLAAPNDGNAPDIAELGVVKETAQDVAKAVETPNLILAPEQQTKPMDVDPPIVVDLNHNVEADAKAAAAPLDEPQTLHTDISSAFEPDRPTNVFEDLLGNHHANIGDGVATLALEPSAEDGISSLEEFEPVFQQLYTSHPIQRLSLGKFEFESATLKLTSEKDVEEFEALLEQQPQQIRYGVKKIPNQISAEFIARMKARSGMRSGIDTTANTLGPSPTQLA